MNTEILTAKSAEGAKMPRRPLLRYFGGKWQLRHWITSYFPRHRFYAEPFAGAASVLLSKQPAPGGEIINDLNGELINLYWVMRNSEQEAELRRRLEWTPYAAAELKLAQLPADDPVERARRLLVRSFMGIEVSGINPKSATGLRMGNVDLGRLDQDGNRTFRNCARDWKNWKREFPVIRDRLADVMIYEKDALEFIRQMDSPETLLYIDPPYCQLTRSSTRYAVEFDQHCKLVELLLSVKSMVALSGYESEVHQLLKAAGWRKESKPYRANMSLRRRMECLWISPNCDSKNDAEKNEKGGGF